MVKTGVVRIRDQVFISGGPRTREKYSEYEMGCVCVSVCCQCDGSLVSRERSAENDVMAANLIPGPTHIMRSLS